MTMQRMIVRPISRRTLLKGASIALGLPFLEAMRCRSLSAQTLSPQRFLAFFCPCGTEPSRWEPKVTDAMTEAALTECLVDMKGFEAEQEWPASGPVFSDITWITNVNHEAICADIHNPAMALCAHNAKGASPEVPPEATLDQYLAERIQDTTPFRSLTCSATGDTAITQGFMSFRGKGQSEAVYRDAKALFDAVFAGRTLEGGGTAGTPMVVSNRQTSILDYATQDATSLAMRLGAEDKQRVERYLASVRELEQQLQTTTAPTSAGCAMPTAPERSRDMHTNTKLMLDLTLMAFQCDLTRVAVVQYSNSWDVNYGKYKLPDGVSDWSDHFISHKLGDNDRAKDLDDVADRDEAMRIANARVVQTSRFKARRFANVVSALKDAPSASGSLFDETLALYCSENGDGDSHSRKRVPYMLAGKAGGFKPGRVVDAGGKPTGALHASILNYFGQEVDEYGSPASGPVPGL